MIFLVFSRVLRTKLKWNKSTWIDIWSVWAGLRAVCLCVYMVLGDWGREKERRGAMCVIVLLYKSAIASWISASQSKRDSCSSSNSKRRHGFFCAQNNNAHETCDFERSTAHSVYLCTFVLIRLMHTLLLLLLPPTLPLLLSMLLWLWLYPWSESDRSVWVFKCIWSWHLRLIENDAIWDHTFEHIHVHCANSRSSD